MEGGEDRIAKATGGLVRTRLPEADVRIERKIITGMIVSDRVMREIRPMLNGRSSFQSAYAGRVAGWCADYWEKYSKSPGRDIEDVYLAHKKDVPEDEAVLLEKFLASLSDEYEKGDIFNADYVLDNAEKHFRLSSLKKIRDDLTKCIVGGRIDDGESLVKEYQRPIRKKSSGVDLLRDRDFVISALVPDEENPDVIIQLPGALGKATDVLERGQLVAVQAESGVGKTWFLLFISYLAAMRGYNVVFFSLEMGLKKLVRRMWQTLSGLPFKGDGIVKIPVFDCQLNKSGGCGKRGWMGQSNGDHIPCDACRNDWTKDEMCIYFGEVHRDLLRAPSAIDKMGTMERSGILRKAGRFHIEEFPSNSITVGEMKSHIINLEYYDDFIPDVIVTDYADKFKWDNPQDARISIGRIWGEHKGLAQELHALVVTASQSNTEKSGKRVGKQSWAETAEKRRMLDVGIDFNQSEKDKEDCLLRASVGKLRDGEAVNSGEIIILQQLALGRPYLDSCFLRRGKKG